MKQARRVSSCLVAAVVIAAVGAASASALPEVGRCVAKAGGKYSDANCNVKATKGKGTFEFVKGTGGQNNFTASGGAAFLEGESGSKMTCTANSAVGKYDEGPGGVVTELEAVKFTFTGCTLPLIGASCQNTANEGEIVTNSLHGPLGYISKFSKSVGLELTPDVKKGAFVEYECGRGAIHKVVKEGPKKGGNCIISTLTPVNTMRTTETSTYKGTAGKQEPNKFEGKPECNLEGKTTGETEREDWNLEQRIQNEVALEVRA